MSVRKKYLKTKKSKVLAVIAGLVVIGAVAGSEQPKKDVNKPVEQMIESENPSHDIQTPVSEVAVTESAKTEPASAVPSTATKQTTAGNTADANVPDTPETNQVMIPAYTGHPYTVINDNEPAFSDEDKSRTDAFETYSSLDRLGRCGVAYANICKELMPTQKREGIGQIKPSGWYTVKYDFVDGKYLYNRCHLIGYQLAGENANAKNLITGTRYLNVSGMLPFENMVDDYVDETNHHVLYRVTPMFDGDNLLATGVQMEAWSVEDKGAGICFNVFCYNVQPGVVIDYATGMSSADGNSVEQPQETRQPQEMKQAQQPQETKQAQQPQEMGQPAEPVGEQVWIPRTGKKYHKNSSCSDMKNPSQVSIDVAKERGFTPCSKCY